MEPTEVLRRPFDERVRSARAWAWFAFRAPRWWVTLILASLPPFLALLGAALLPQEFQDALTSPSRVHDTFARFVGAIATASAIAVSVATLTLGRQLRGLKNLEGHLREDEAFRDRMRRGRQSLPLSIGGFLSVLYGDVAAAARRALATPAKADLDVEVEGARLGELLDALEAQASRAAHRTDAWRQHPERMMAVALDFEEEMAAHLARVFLRSDRVDTATHERLEQLLQRLDETTIARAYAKTLDTQYALSRMSTTLLVSAFGAVFVAAAMVLTYGEGVREAWGAWGATGLVAGALFAVALPLATFVSYLLRVVFLNAHTLPTRGFVVGRELAAHHRERHRPGRPGRPGRA